jgi:hypothetical protein
VAAGAACRIGVALGRTLAARKATNFRTSFSLAFGRMGGRACAAPSPSPQSEEARSTC